MRIGISGVHHSGKTTLAKKLASRMSCDFIALDISDVFKQRNIIDLSDVALNIQMEIQYEILLKFKQLTSNKSAFVIDRTPVDFIAYTLADYTRSRVVGMPEDFASVLESYVSLCQSEAEDNLDFNIILPQMEMDNYVDRSKATGSLNPFYMRHVSSLIFGEAMDTNYNVTKLFVDPECPLDQRCDHLFNELMNTIEKEHEDYPDYECDYVH